MENFKTVLKQTVNQDFILIPNSEQEIDYVFSDHFLVKMNRMLRAQKRPIWNLGQSIPKKIAIVFVVILCLFITACGIPEVREAVTRFVIELKDGGLQFDIEGELPDVIEKELELNIVPDGFVQIDKIVTRSSRITTYENPEGGRIMFSQCAPRYYGGAMDTDHLNVYSLEINDIEVIIGAMDNYVCASWIQESYVIILDYKGEITIEDFIELIQSVQ